jgi:hypothetical protein
MPYQYYYEIMKIANFDTLAVCQAYQEIIYLAITMINTKNELDDNRDPYKITRVARCQCHYCDRRDYCNYDYWDVSAHSTIFAAFMAVFKP